MSKPERLSILTELREQSGLSLTEMAKACGLVGTQARKTVGRWEQGEVTPKLRRRAKFKSYLWDTLRLRKTPESFLEVWEILVEEWHWDELSAEEWKELTHESRPKLSSSSEEELQEIAQESDLTLSNENDTPVRHDSWIRTDKRSTIVIVAASLLLVTVILLLIDSGWNSTKNVGATAKDAVPTSAPLAVNTVTTDELNESQQPTSAPLAVDTVTTDELNGPQRSTSVPATLNQLPCTTSAQKDAPILGIASFDKRGAQQNLRLEEGIFDRLFKLQKVAAVCRFEEVVKNKLDAQNLMNKKNIEVLIWGGLDDTALVTNIEGLEDTALSPRSPEEVADITFYTEEYPKLIGLVTSLAISQIYFFNAQRVDARSTLKAALNEAMESPPIVDNNKKALAKSYSFLGYMFQYAPPPEKLDIVEAIKFYEISRDLDPNTPDSDLINLASLYQKSKNYEGAEEIYTNIINSGRLNWSTEARLGRSSALIMQGKPNYEMAIIDFNKVICDYKNQDSKEWLGFAHLAMSSTWLLANEEEKATKSFSDSLCYWGEENRERLHVFWQSFSHENPEFTNMTFTFTTTLKHTSLPMACEPPDPMLDCTNIQ